MNKVSYIFGVVFGCVLLISCEDSDINKQQNNNHSQELSSISDETKSVDVAVYEPDTSNKIELEDESDTEAQTIDDDSQIPETVDIGTAEFVADFETVTIVSNQASVNSLLKLLADDLEFTVHFGEKLDGIFSIERTTLSLQSLISKLLKNTVYSIDYKKYAENEDHIIGDIRIGHKANFIVQQKAQALHNPSNHVQAYDLGFSYNGELSLMDSSDHPEGHVQNVMDYGSIEDKLELINELDLNNQGIRTLGAILKSNTDSSVRAEVISILSSSDSFASKWIILSSLKDADPKVVQTSLETILTWQDPSTVPYVKSLLSNSNEEVRNLANEIVEYNSDVDTEIFTDLTEEQQKQIYRQQQKLNTQLNEQRAASRERINDRHKNKP